MVRLRFKYGICLSSGDLRGLNQELYMLNLQVGWVEPQVLIVLTGKLPMFPKLVGGRSAIFHAPRSVLVRFARFYAESHLWRGGDGKDRPCRGGRKASMSLESVHHVFSLSFPEGILLPWNGTLVKLSVISKVGRVMSRSNLLFQGSLLVFFNYPRFLINLPAVRKPPLRRC